MKGEFIKVDLTDCHVVTLLEWVNLTDQEKVDEVERALEVCETRISSTLEYFGAMAGSDWQCSAAMAGFQSERSRLERALVGLRIIVLKKERASLKRLMEGDELHSFCTSAFGGGCNICLGPLQRSEEYLVLSRKIDALQDRVWTDPICGCSRSPDVERTVPCPTCRPDVVEETGKHGQYPHVSEVMAARRIHIDKLFSEAERLDEKAEQAERIAKDATALAATYRCDADCAILTARQADEF